MDVLDNLKRLLDSVPTPLTHERNERLITTKATIAHAPGDLGPVLFGPPETVAFAVAAINALPRLIAVARAAERYQKVDAIAGALFGSLDDPKRIIDVVRTSQDSRDVADAYDQLIVTLAALKEAHL